MDKLTLLLAIILVNVSLLVAQPGEITGIITEEGSDLPIPANVLIEGRDIGTLADENGKYTIKPLQPGLYNVRFEVMGYKPLVMEGVRVNSDAIVNLDVQLEFQPLTEVVVTAERRKYENLIDMTIAAPQPVITAEELEDQPIVNYVDAISTTAEVYQSDAGETPIFRGSRPENTIYMFEGMRMVGSNYISRAAIGSVRVISGGMPAKYGDSTGGIVIINMKSTGVQ